MMIASLAALVQTVAPLALSQKATASMKSTQIAASIAALVLTVVP